ncbi:hypothetical protein QBC34DRAFT_410593 [Podospora aff. communis PSN243]|uniref:Ubiquitin 3 binding protein But2 C-terminal domain-containing protein n=1 Tax=Podospora aff. communis PSN243 TaxID=3040156 RepID=A0AAV9GHV2_9PEZI|nr:hypothetical protein QBC34DRAFT_410593 [Podospora aff. communis PSN243]
MLKNTLYLTLLPLTTLALPNPAGPNGPKPLELQPSKIVLHDTHWDVQNVCDPGLCQAYKATNSNGHDLTTLLTFTYPPTFNGKTCWLEFATPSVSQGGTVDVFTQWSPVNTCPSMGNNRDAQLGRMEAPWGGGKATWTATYSGYMTTPGPCKAAGTVEGFEVTGAGDVVNVTWKQLPGMGLRVMYFV